MKKRFIYSLICYFCILGGSITFGATIDMKFIHYIAMILLMIGGYFMALSSHKK
jgi:hypothetical protein